jgi:hypothetical protein
VRFTPHRLVVSSLPAALCRFLGGGSASCDIDRWATYGVSYRYCCNGAAARPDDAMSGIFMISSSGCSCIVSVAMSCQCLGCLAA